MQGEKVADYRSPKQNHADHDCCRTHVFVPLIAHLEVYGATVRLVLNLT